MPLLSNTSRIDDVKSGTTPKDLKRRGLSACGWFEINVRLNLERILLAGMDLTLRFLFRSINAQFLIDGTMACGSRA
jgi:hypothetical protein